MTHTDDPCECGRGTVVLLRDGTRCCTWALARFEAVYGRAFTAAGSRDNA